MYFFIPFLRFNKVIAINQRYKSTDLVFISHQFLLKLIRFSECPQKLYLGAIFNFFEAKFGKWDFS